MASICMLCPSKPVLFASCILLSNFHKMLPRVFKASMDSLCRVDLDFDENVKIESAFDRQMLNLNNGQSYQP